MNARSWFYGQSFNGGTRNRKPTPITSDTDYGQGLSEMEMTREVLCAVCGSNASMKCTDCDTPLCSKRECYSVHGCTDAEHCEEIGRGE